MQLVDGHLCAAGTALQVLSRTEYQAPLTMACNSFIFSRARPVIFGMMKGNLQWMTRSLSSCQAFGKRCHVRERSALQQTLLDSKPDNRSAYLVAGRVLRFRWDLTSSQRCSYACGALSVDLQDLL